MTTFKKFNLGDVKLQLGGYLRQAHLVYKTYGALSPRRDNVVLLPTFYTGTHERNEGFFGLGRAIDPQKHYIVCINMFGNGLSSSPSNAIGEQAGPGFPLVTLQDNVTCQQRLLTQQLGITQIALVAGWSMAGCQAYQWAAQYPDMVDAILPFCASAKTSIHNFVFLEGVKAALCADTHWQFGHYKSPPIAGLKAFARVYAGWAFSQTFYRQKIYQTLGFKTAEDLLLDWEADHVKNWDANNLLAKLNTWQRADISDCADYGGDIKKALAAIKARAILMPCSQDLYFPPEDNEFEARYMPNAQYRPYDSVWGHCAANPGNDAGFKTALDENIRALLD